MVVGLGISLTETSIDVANRHYKTAAVHGLDAVMCVVGALGGPVGAFISGGYFTMRMCHFLDDVE